MLLATLIAWLNTQFANVVTAVSGAFNSIILEVPTDEVAILHGALKLAATDLQGGKSADQTFTDTLNYVQAQEGAELSKLSQQLLQVFITATAPSATS